MHPNSRMENNKEYKSIKDELKDIAPGLADVPKKDSFTVPENFFEKFSVIVSDKVQAQKNKSWLDVLMQSVLKPVYALPVVAVIAFGSYKYLQPTNPVATTEAVVTVEDLSQDEIISQLDENIITDEVADLTTEDNTTSSETSDIENYLIDNNTDINTLANEL